MDSKSDYGNFRFCKETLRDGCLLFPPMHTNIHLVCACPSAVEQKGCGRPSPLPSPPPRAAQRLPRLSRFLASCGSPAILPRVKQKQGTDLCRWKELKNHLFHSVMLQMRKLKLRQSQQFVQSHQGDQSPPGDTSQHPRSGGWGG